MSRDLPTPPLELDTLRAFGPHRAYADGLRVDSGVVPDKVVKTHCCFCGQQCGVQLKVKDDTVPVDFATSSPSMVSGMRRFALGLALGAREFCKCFPLLSVQVRNVAISL